MQPPDYVHRDDLVGPVLDNLARSRCKHYEDMTVRIGVDSAGQLLAAICFGNQETGAVGQGGTLTVALMHAIARAEKEQTHGRI